jgi:glycosyltransferase involved in cell wall biosynthesis
LRYDMSPSWGDELVMICRMEHHKRQHLAVEAMKHVSTPVRLRLCGESSNEAYMQALRDSIVSKGLGERVILEARWISEEEKANYLSSALAAVYLAEDEDSYGYPTLEAAHATKATVVTQDGGGVREFVVDGESGLVAAPEPAALAACFDRLWSNRNEARALGRAAAYRMQELGIGWEHITRVLIEAAAQDPSR